MAIARDPLVSTDWLARRLYDSNIRTVNADWYFPHEDRDARREFQAAHIPGAVFFDIEDVADHATDLPHMLPTPEAFAEAVGDLGLGNGSTIVVYESGAPRSAARVWWTFRAMGHADVVVLDGGLQKWRAERRPMETGARKPTPGVFTSRYDSTLVRDAADVRDVVHRGGAQIADARPASRFCGDTAEPREGLKCGHMPGAFSLPSNTLYAADGTMLPTEQLRHVIETAGIDPKMPVIATCGSGITACMIALALARLGRSDTAVYDGSWAEWGALPDAPVVAGA